MNSLAGTGSLIRFILRRDRVRLPVWIVATVGTTVLTGASFLDLYPTAVDRQARAILMEGPLGRAFSGPSIGLDNYTFGAMMSNEMIGILAVVVALMSVFLVVRHTRADEQSGRSELVRSAVVGRHAPMTAVVTVVSVAHLVIGGLIAVSLPELGLDLSRSGSVLFGLAVAGVGIVFAGIAAVAVQVSGYPRGAVGLGSSAVGIAYMIRAAGDIGENPGLSMLSPIGWAQATSPYVDDTWWPLILHVIFFVAFMSGAVALIARRDFGAGLLAARSGNSEARKRLASPIGLALRLQRGLLIGWGVGLFVLGTTYGGFVSDVEEFASSNEFIQDALAEIGGGGLAESWSSFILLFSAALVASFAVQSALRLRSEELELHAENILATPFGRTKWVGGYLVVGVAGSALLLALSGLGFGLTAAASTGDGSWVLRMFGASLAHLPAVSVVAGFAIAIFGLLPKLSAMAWALVTLVWVSWLGQIIGLPEWVANLSPLGHTPLVPASDFDIVPLSLLALIAAALMWLGVWGFKRRDVGVV